MSAAPPQSGIEWTLSIVSHGHGASVNRLLGDCRRLLDPARYEIIVTVNCPEDVPIDTTIWPGPFFLLTNSELRGFASNHNWALSRARGAYVAAIDPDLRLQVNPFADLARFLAERPMALAAPMVADSQGRVQDSMRRVVTPAALWRRYAQRPRRPDYAPTDQPLPVDWIAGLFVATSRRFFVTQRGFDERFHLYCEDTELSLRCWNAGGEVWSLPIHGVVHDARRQTLRDVRHFLWHCGSLLRLWASATFWRYLRGPRAGPPR